MRRIVLILWIVCTTILTSNGQENGSYEIKFKVTGFEDSVAYLGYHFGDKKYLEDTSKVTPEGEMVFSGNYKLKSGVYFLYTPKFYMEFLVNEPEFSIETNKDAIYDDMIVTNSRENEYFKVFQMIMLGHQKKVRALSEELSRATTKDDSTRIYELVEELRSANEDQRDSLRLASEGTYISTLLNLIKKPSELQFEVDSLTDEQKKEKYDFYKRNFFNGINLSTDGLMRAPVFYSKVMEFMEKVTFQTADSVITSVDYLLDGMKDNPETHRFWIVTLFQQYQNPKVMGLDRVFIHIADNYYLNGTATWADESMIRELKDELKFHRENQLGLIAPQIHLLDSTLAPVDLYSQKKDYTVLYFYDPDCGHCKKKTPELVDIYHNMNGDVEVMAVNVGTDIQKWKSFIDKNNMDWINAADPYYKSNFRMQYNVRSTPTIYVLDKNKKIIAKRLNVEDIEGFINDHRAYMNKGL